MIYTNKSIGGGRKSYEHYEIGRKQREANFYEVKEQCSKQRQARKERHKGILKGKNKKDIETTQAELDIETQLDEEYLIPEDAKFDEPENPFFPPEAWDAFDAMGIRPANGVEVDL